MARPVTNLNLGTEERLALETLSRTEGRSVSQLLHDAVRFYLARPGAQERSLTDTLERLRAYREHDPDFSLAIASYGQDELSAHEPVEDTVLHKPEEAKAAASGPVQTRLHALLRA